MDLIEMFKEKWLERINKEGKYFIETYKAKPFMEQAIDELYGCLPKKSPYSNYVNGIRIAEEIEGGNKVIDRFHANLKKLVEGE